MDLNEQILTVVQNSGLGDDDARSALGMAYSWTRENKPFTPSPQPGYQKRDVLATQLIETLQEHPTDGHREALAHARRVINQPYAVESVMGNARQKGDKKSRAGA